MGWLERPPGPRRVGPTLASRGPRRYNLGVRLSSSSGVELELHDLGGSGAPLLIAHATGFCAGAYVLDVDQGKVEKILARATILATGPATNLALFKLALLIRLTRAGTRESLLQDYVKFARAKGLTNGRVIGVHVLRNILIPIVTVIGLEFGSVIAFAIVTESVFAWPGMGKLFIDSINLLDRPVIVSYLLVIVTLFIVINLAVDVLYSALDPRVRLSESKG